jgi:hypothetical protein
MIHGNKLRLRVCAHTRWCETVVTRVSGMAHGEELRIGNHKMITVSFATNHVQFRKYSCMIGETCVHFLDTTTLVRHPSASQPGVHDLPKE